MTVVDAHIVVDHGPFGLDVALRLAPGEVVAMVGPNGAGKTTALRALAGLQPVHDGHIRLDGELVDRPADQHWVPPESRPVGVVFQDYLLFPHLTARDNVAFGPRRRGLDRAAARRLADRLLAGMGLAEFADRRPRHLSGGQAQRVALARALATDPSLLLLDEPLAALDAGTRLDTRTVLHTRLADHPKATLLVTHDLVDALVLADRIIVVENGRTVQSGDPTVVTSRPRTRYVARLAGLNLLRGTGTGHTITVPGLTVTSGTDLPDRDRFAAFPPDAVRLHAVDPGERANRWRTTVTGMHRNGDRLRVALSEPADTVADIPFAVAAGLDLTPGTDVWATIDPDRVAVYPV